MNDEFLLSLPAYTLLLKDSTGALLLRHGQDMWLPLFTDEDAVRTFVERSGLAVQRGLLRKAGKTGGCHFGTSHVFTEKTEPGKRYLRCTVKTSIWSRRVDVPRLNPAKSTDSSLAVADWTLCEAFRAACQQSEQ